eukprot:424372-Rhodomonas_salina.1
MKRADLCGFALVLSPACSRMRIACKVSLRAANGVHDCSCRLSSTVKARKVAASAMHGLFCCGWDEKPFPYLSSSLP